MNWQSKMTKSRIRLAMCLILLLVGMAACSSDPGSDNNANNGNNGEADTEVMADADEDATDAGSDATDTDDEPDADAGADAEDDGSDADLSATLELRVLSHDGDPIESATITVAGTQQQTDAAGLAEFGELDAGRTVALVEAEGYAPSTAVAELAESASTTRSVRLLATGEPHAFDPTTPSDLYEDRVRVSIPANALEDAQGNDYTGAAQALITPLNPSTDELGAMPGPLDGILEGDTEPTPMESIFMADIQLQTDTGEPLSLKDGMNATLEFVLPDDLQDDYTVGDSIEAYWYDTDQGLWMQEGNGDVIESTYAAEKLAWTVEVSHFTWWNCDRPWTDKECVRVEVVDASNGDPVPGAQIYVRGESYNGTSYGSSGVDGTACLDFKLGSTALVSASSPDGRPQIGSPVQITGNGTAATCSGDGTGTCQQVQLQLPPMTCVSGAVNNDNGDPIEDVSVTGYYAGLYGTVSASATTDASGEYCLEVPAEVDTSIVASYLDNGTFMSASSSVTAGDTAQSCGGGACTDAGTLIPQASQDGCISGEVTMSGPSAGPDPVAPGTHVYVFDGQQGDAPGFGDFVIDCDKDPEEWGTLLGESSTDANGEFCVSAPLTAGELSVVVGKCGSASERCFQVRPGVTVTQAATCGDGNCTPLIEPIYMSGRECGEGP